MNVKYISRQPLEVEPHKHKYKVSRSSLKRLCKSFWQKACVSPKGDFYKKISQRVMNNDKISQMGFEQQQNIAERFEQQLF